MLSSFFCYDRQLVYTCTPKIPQSALCTPASRTLSNRFMTKMQGCNHSRRPIISSADHFECMTLSYYDPFRYACTHVVPSQLTRATHYRCRPGQFLSPPRNWLLDLKLLIQDPIPFLLPFVSARTFNGFVYTPWPAGRWACRSGGWPCVVMACSLLLCHVLFRFGDFTEKVWTNVKSILPDQTATWFNWDFGKWLLVQKFDGNSLVEKCFRFIVVSNPSSNLSHIL